MQPLCVSRERFGMLASLVLMGLVVLIQAGGGPSGGDVRAIAMDPVNSDTVYAGTEGGAK